MNGIIYYTKIRDEYNSKNMEHMIGEKLLEIGLEREFGRKLAFEPRSKGEHGKPFFTLLPPLSQPHSMKSTHPRHNLNEQSCHLC